jgi:hypothetical protein
MQGITRLAVELAAFLEAPGSMALLLLYKLANSLRVSLLYSVSAWQNSSSMQCVICTDTVNCHDHTALVIHE